MKTKIRISASNGIMLILVLVIHTGCMTNSDVYNPNVSGTRTDRLKVYTTLDKTIIPDTTPTIKVRIDDPANFAKNGYGLWKFGPGLASQKRFDLMPDGYDNRSVTKTARLLRFFTMTDIHITDKESPAQAIFFAPYAKTVSISCYSPLMLYSTQVLDAAVQTINELNKKETFDIGLALGDLVNSTQYNELRWFIDIMDGKRINPDSGTKDDPIAGPGNDYQDEFTAAGLCSSIPWYAAIGNHDHFWMGSKPVNDRIRETLVSGNILQLGNVFSKTDPDIMNENTYSLGTIDGSTPYGTIIGSGVVATMGTIPTIPADANRRSLSKTEWMKEFSNTTSLPVGHGFVQTNSANLFGACYSFLPKSGLPLKIIVLDDTQDDSDISNDIYGHGSLENGRHDWLISQLQAGQAANQLMIIAAHIPIGVAPGTEVGWYDATVESNLIAELKTYPNLILWVSGHRHLNNVTAFPSTDTSHPEKGFWEVETKSLREFPEQFRTFDIMLNSDNSISIITTNVDPNMKTGSLAATARSYAIASNQIYGLTGDLLPTGSVSYNAELIKQLSPEMQMIIKNCRTVTNR